jgi:Clp amino terminal domain
MKKQYSKWALKALKLAEETARKCSHNYIGTEHILAGLLAVKDSTAGEILTEAGISLKKLLELMEKLVAPSSEVLLEEPQGYTPRSKKILEKASEEATNMESAEIGTEHILIAMLKETDCVGARLLHTMGAGNQKTVCRAYECYGERRHIDKRRKECHTNARSVWQRFDRNGCYGQAGSCCRQGKRN